MDANGKQDPPPPDPHEEGFAAGLTLAEAFTGWPLQHGDPPALFALDTPFLAPTEVETTARPELPAKRTKRGRKPIPELTGGDAA